jgi:hypothetical protein
LAVVVHACLKRDLTMLQFYIYARSLQPRVTFLTVIQRRGASGTVYCFSVGGKVTWPDVTAGLMWHVSAWPVLSGLHVSMHFIGR